MSNLLTRMLDRVGRKTEHEIFAAAGRKGVAAKRDKKAAAEQEAGQAQALTVEAVAASCEDCAAKLEHRSPANNTDMARHKLERHDTLLLPLFNSAARPAN
jgi:hypothetical protein